MAKRYYWLLRHVDTGRIIRAGKTARDIGQYIGANTQTVIQRGNHHNVFNGYQVEKVDADLHRLKQEEADLILRKYDSPCAACADDPVCSRYCREFHVWLGLKLRLARAAAGVSER